MAQKVNSPGRTPFDETFRYLKENWKTFKKIVKDLSELRTLNKIYFMKEIDWKSIRKYQ
jgi:hypothetical protein